MYVTTSPDGRFCWVICRPDGAIKSPSCHSSIEYSQHIYVRYSFSKCLLSDWQTIDEGVLNLILKFEINTRQGLQDFMGVYHLWITDKDDCINLRPTLIFGPLCGDCLGGASCRACGVAYVLRRLSSTVTWLGPKSLVFRLRNLGASELLYDSKEGVPLCLEGYYFSRHFFGGMASVPRRVLA